MTAPTSTYNRNTGPVQRAQGSVTGTYTAATDVSATANASIADGVLTITLGFVPTFVKVQNVTDKISVEWFKGMASGSCVKTIANGTVSLETTNCPVVITARTGTGGSVSQAGGTADTSASGVVTLTFATGSFSGDNDVLAWIAEG